MSIIQRLYEEITEQQLWQKDIQLKRNEYLKVKGSVDLNLYYVLEGSLRIFIVEGEEEHTMRFGYQGEFITALDSYLSGEPSELYIQAIRQTNLKSIPKSSFMRLINASSELHAMWYHMLEQLFRQQMEREIDLLITSPAERYRRVLERSPHLFQEVPNKYIASYLRMTPETLSRINKS